MNVWISENNPGRQVLLALLCSLAGLALAIGFFSSLGARPNATAGFLLGLLLLGIGGFALLGSGRQTVVVDPRRREIQITNRNLFGTGSNRSIPFSDIVRVGIGYCGKRSALMTWYYLVLHLQSGEEYALFPPGRFFQGGNDRTVVAGWKQRLEGYIRR